MVYPISIYFLFKLFSVLLRLRTQFKIKVKPTLMISLSEILVKRLLTTCERKNFRKIFELLTLVCTKKCIFTNTTRFLEQISKRQYVHLTVAVNRSKRGSRRFHEKPFYRSLSYVKVFLEQLHALMFSLHALMFSSYIKVFIFLYTLSQ